jgi:ribosomal protein S18 acetylase RimI-like enzyme
MAIGLPENRTTRANQVETKTPLEIRIRRAKDDDAEAIAALMFKSFVEYRFLYTPEGFAATAITAGEVSFRIAEGPVWVAVSGELIVGTVSVVSKGEALYIRGMAVLPAARGQRVGAMLLTHVEGFATTNNYRRLLLSTTPFLDRAIRLYERFGFQRTEAGPNELFGTPLFSMEKAKPAGRSCRCT